MCTRTQTHFLSLHVSWSHVTLVTTFGNFVSRVLAMVLILCSLHMFSVKRLQKKNSVSCECCSEIWFAVFIIFLLCAKHFQSADNIFIALLNNSAYPNSHPLANLLHCSFVWNKVENRLLMRPHDWTYC